MKVSVGGLQIYYRDEGPREAPLLVLLHGWGSNTDLFEDVYRCASGRYRVVGPDFPGSGKSAEPATPMNLEDYASFVEEFLRAVAPEAREATFLGHSHGGRVLIYMAAKQGREDQTTGVRIRRLILVDSAGIVPERTEAQKKRTARYKRWKSLLTATGVARLFPGTLEALQRRFGSADYAAASPVMRQTMVRVVNADLTDQMPQVRVPALLIWGERDTATPLSDGKRMEELMPEAGLAVIPGVGHFSFLENPYHFRRILSSFLEL